jgi:hypothetical protein
MCISPSSERVAFTAFHDLPDLVHETPCRTLTGVIVFARLDAGQAFGRGGHFENSTESITQAGLDLAEQGIGCGSLPHGRTCRMVLLTCDMTAFGTGKAVWRLDCMTGGVIGKASRKSLMFWPEKVLIRCIEHQPATKKGNQNPCDLNG